MTYSVSLCFADGAAAMIADVMRKIADATQNRYFVEHGVPPHITLGMFRAPENDDGNVDAVAVLRARAGDCARFAAGTPHTVRLTHIGAFAGKALFAAPGNDPFLAELNARLHAPLPPQCTPGANRLYLPQNWTPHVALATKLSPAQFVRALQAARTLPLPLDAPAAALVLAQRRPYRELARWEVI